MVAPHDLNRYVPPLDYLRGRVDGLLRLLDGGVDPGFVRRECGELLRELVDFAVRHFRFDFPALEARVVAASSVDVHALQAAYDVIAGAPRHPGPPLNDVDSCLRSLLAGVAAIRDNQHRFPLIETLLRLELALEGWYTGAIIAISDTWDPEPLLALVRRKIAALSDQDRADLWSRVLAENRPVDDEDLRDFRLVDHGVLPPRFLRAAPPDLTDRLARYIAWLRPRIVREMLRRGAQAHPVPAVGLAKVLALLNRAVELSSTELSIVRAVGNLAGWLALRSQPFSVEELAPMLGLKSDGRLMAGEERQAFEKTAWPRADAPERAALYSIVTLASATDALHGYETPLRIALFQYKAGIELFAPEIASKMRRGELHLQKELCKFLLERGIFSVGTRFGQNETDLVAKVRDDYIVLECKVLKTVPSVAALERNLSQLLQYDSLNLAFRGRRAVLVLYNFSDAPILEPREVIAGRVEIVAINAAAGPPSRTKRCVQVVPDTARAIRCVEIAGDRTSKRAVKNPRRR